jgi:hypothetical protein
MNTILNTWYNHQTPLMWIVFFDICWVYNLQKTEYVVRNSNSFDSYNFGNKMLKIYFIFCQIRQPRVTQHNIRQHRTTTITTKLTPHHHHHTTTTLPTHHQHTTNTPPPHHHHTTTTPHHHPWPTGDDLISRQKSQPSATLYQIR